MKKIILAIAVSTFSFSQAYASGGIVCELEANVKQIQALGVLDESVSASRITGTDTYRYVATLEITSAVKTWGTGECPMGEQLIQLKQGEQVKIGDALKIQYSFIHDRPGQSTTYRIK